MLDVIFHAGAVPFGYVSELTMERETLVECMDQRVMPLGPKQSCGEEINESSPRVEPISRTTTPTHNRSSLRGFHRSETKEEEVKVNKIPGGVEEREEVKRLKEEQKQVWREVGRDLRHIADTFTIKKTQADRSKATPSSTTRPDQVSVTGTRCLAASLLALACWGVFSRLRCN